MKKYLILLIPLLFFTKTAFASSIFTQTGSGSEYSQTNFQFAIIMDWNNTYGKGTFSSHPTGEIDQVQLYLSSSSAQSVRLKMIDLAGANWSDCHTITNTKTLFDFKFSANVTFDYSFPQPQEIEIYPYSEADCASSSGTQNLKVYGSGPNRDGYFVHAYPSGGNFYSTDFQPYIVVGTNLPYGSLHVDQPTDLETVPLGNLTVSGTCPINGTDRIGYKWPWSPGPTTYNQDCTDHEFSFTINVDKIGPTAIHVWDSDFDIDQNPIYNYIRDFIVYDPENGYNLFQIFPSCSNNNCILRPATNWKFRFGYSLPQGTNRADVQSTLIETDENGDMIGSPIGGNDLESLDPDNLGYFDVEDIVSELSTTHYYSIDLSFNSVIKTGLQFSTYGSEDATALPKRDPDQICPSTPIVKELCGLVIPNQSRLRSIYNQLKDQMTTKFPFAYFTIISTKFQETLADIEDESNNNLNIAVVPIHTNLVNINAPIFGSSDITEKITDSLDFFRPFIIIALWLSFITYLWFRITNLTL